MLIEKFTNSRRDCKLGRKYIKSFAGGIAHMFACSAVHYAWLAYQYQKSEMTIDLLSLRIEPVEFDIERNRILASMCRRTLLRNIEHLRFPGAVVSAVLLADFGIDDFTEDGQTASIGRSSFTVVLTDDRGKEWRAERKADRMLVAR